MAVGTAHGAQDVGDILPATRDEDADACASRASLSVEILSDSRRRIEHEPEVFGELAFADMLNATLCQLPSLKRQIPLAVSLNAKRLRGTLQEYTRVLRNAGHG